MGGSRTGSNQGNKWIAVKEMADLSEASNYRVVDLSTGWTAHREASFAVLLAGFRDLGVVPGVPCVGELVPIAFARLTLVKPVLLLEALSGGVI